MLRDQSIGFIGGGNMGEALISGLIDASLFPAEKVFAHDVMPSRIQYLEKELAIKGRSSIGEPAAKSCAMEACSEAAGCTRSTSRR